MGTVVDLRQRMFKDISETRIFSTNNYYTMELLHDNTVGYTVQISRIYYEYIDIKFPRKR